MFENGEVALTSETPKQYAVRLVVLVESASFRGFG